MDVAVFLNAKNMQVLPHKNLFVSTRVSITKKDFMGIVKWHKTNNKKITHLILRFGDPLDNGIEFFNNLLAVLDNNGHSGSTVTIETPMIAYLKCYPIWIKLFSDERVKVKAVFNYGEKDSYGRFFSDSELERAYSRFYSSFKYRPALIYYKTDDSVRYESCMESLASRLNTTLEIRDVTNNKFDWINEDEIFYSNVGHRYKSSKVWFIDNPYEYGINSIKETLAIRNKVNDAEAEAQEKLEKAKRQKEHRRLLEEKEDALLKAISEKPKRKTRKSSVRKTPIFSPEQKQQMQEAKRKALETLNSKRPRDMVNKIDLFKSIERHRQSDGLN